MQWWYFIFNIRGKVINGKTRCIIKYSAVLEKSSIFNWREHLSVGAETERKREKTYKWSASRSEKLLELSSEWKLSILWAKMRRISISLSLSHSSHSPFSRTAVILAPIFSPVLFCDVVESIYRGYPRPPDPVFSSFFRQARFARKWGAATGGGDLISRFS